MDSNAMGMHGDAAAGTRFKQARTTVPRPCKGHCTKVLSTKHSYWANTATGQRVVVERLENPRLVPSLTAPSGRPNTMKLHNNITADSHHSPALLFRECPAQGSAQGDEVEVVWWWGTGWQM